MRSIRFAVVVAVSILFALPACEPGEAGEEGVAVEAGALQAGDLVVEIALGQTSYAASDPVVASVTLSNLSNHPVKLVSWLLPDRDLEEDLFSVSRDGKPVAFLGPHYKRAPVGDADFVLLPAGESLTRSVDLARYYDFTRSGRYSVQVTLPLKADRSRQLSAKQGGEAHVDAHSAPQPESLSVTAVSGDFSFSRCTDAQQSTLVNAAGAADAMSANALAYLGGTSAGPRYTTWFGAYSSARWSTAKQHFSALTDAFETQRLTFDCRCKKKNVYAYVYPSQPYAIYLCGVFWKSPLTGTDSQGGTLVHEMSHFNVVAGTDDWAYGQSACKALAISDPNKAIDNADSHEYFAENTPAQN